MHSQAEEAGAAKGPPRAGAPQGAPAGERGGGTMKLSPLGKDRLLHRDPIPKCAGRVEGCGTGPGRPARASPETARHCQVVGGTRKPPVDARLPAERGGGGGGGERERS